MILQSYAGNTMSASEKDANERCKSILCSAENAASGKNLDAYIDKNIEEICGRLRSFIRIIWLQSHDRNVSNPLDRIILGFAAEELVRIALTYKDDNSLCSFPKPSEHAIDMSPFIFSRTPWSSLLVTRDADIPGKPSHVEIDGAHNLLKSDAHLLLTEVTTSWSHLHELTQSEDGAKWYGFIHELPSLCIPRSLFHIMIPPWKSARQEFHASHNQKQLKVPTTVLLWNHAAETLVAFWKVLINHDFLWKE